jgi:hypothetical protein
MLKNKLKIEVDFEGDFRSTKSKRFKKIKKNMFLKINTRPRIWHLVQPGKIFRDIPEKII